MGLLRRRDCTSHAHTGVSHSPQQAIHSCLLLCWVETSAAILLGAAHKKRMHTSGIAAPAAGDPISSSSVSLGEARPPADALEEPAPPAPPSAAAAPAAPLNLSTWRNTRQHDTHGQVVCFAFRFVVLPFALSDARSFRIAS